MAHGFLFFFFSFRMRLDIGRDTRDSGDDESLNLRHSVLTSCSNITTVEIGCRCQTYCGIITFMSFFPCLFLTRACQNVKDLRPGAAYGSHKAGK